MALDDADIKAVELDAQKALLEQVSIYAVHNVECNNAEISTFVTFILVRMCCRQY